MKVVCVWRDNEDYSREVINWLDEFERRTGKRIESLDPDSVEGDSFTRAHDIVEYPSIIAVDNNGRELQLWRGTPLPLIDQVSYYAGEE